MIDLRHIIYSKSKHVSVYYYEYYFKNNKVYTILTMFSFKYNQLGNQYFYEKFKI